MRNFNARRFDTAGFFLLEQRIVLYVVCGSKSKSMPGLLGRSSFLCVRYRYREELFSQNLILYKRIEIVCFSRTIIGLFLHAFFA